MKVHLTPIIANYNIQNKKALLLTSGIVGITAAALTQDSDKFSVDKNKNDVTIAQTPEMIQREQKIRVVLEDAVREDKNMSVEMMAKALGLTFNQVYNCIRCGNGELKQLFDKVKGRANVKRRADKKDIDIVAGLVQKASSLYTTQESDASVHDDYVKSIAKILDWEKTNDNTSLVIRKYFAKFPAFMDELLTVYNKNGNFRLNPKNKGIYLQNLIKAYEKNRNLTEILTFEQNEKGNFKYSLHEIPILVKIHSISPELFEIAKKEQNEKLVLDLLEQKNGTSVRFGVEEIKKIVKYAEKNPEIIKDFVNVKNIDGKYKYKSDQLIKVIDMYSKNPELITKLHTETEIILGHEVAHKYTVECICKIIDTINENDPEKNKLLNGLLQGKPECYPYRYVQKLPSDRIVKELENYDTRKFWMKKIDNENLDSPEFKESFQKQFGNTGYKMVIRLANMGFSVKEIKKILYFTGTQIKESDINKDGNSKYRGPYSSFSISNVFSKFIKKEAETSEKAERPETSERPKEAERLERPAHDLSGEKDDSNGMQRVVIIEGNLYTDKIGIIELIKRCYFAVSSAEAMKLIKQGRISVNGECIDVFDKTYYASDLKEGLIVTCK